MVKCPHCQAPAKVLFSTKDFNQHIDDKVFIYYKCPEDDLIFLYPQPDDLGRYYQNDYYRVPTHLNALIANDSWEQDRVALIQQFLTTGRLLEIGPSYGAFAYFAKQAGYEVDTIEMSEQCCQFLENVVGVRAIQSDVPHETLAALSDTYDVIVMWQVIEHLSEPWEMIEVAAQHLSTGGLLVLGAPNPDAFQFRIFKRRWVHVDPPRHLSLIPSKLLIQYGENFALKTVLLTTRYRENHRHNRFGWKRSLMNYISPRRKKGLLRGVRILLGVIGLVLAQVFSTVDESEGNGSTYITILQKSE